MTQSGVILEDTPLERNLIGKLLSGLDSIRASYCLMSRDDAIVTIRHDGSERGFVLLHRSFREADGGIPENFKPYVVAAYAHRGAFERIQGTLSHLSGAIDASPAAPSRAADLDLVFFQPRGINKGSALAKIAKHLGVSPHETVAIGDAVSNDIPLLRAAGFPVAMKNSGNHLQRIATHTTRFDNNNDGVGQFIRQYWG